MSSIVDSYLKRLENMYQIRSMVEWEGFLSIEIVGFL